MTRLEHLRALSIENVAKLIVEDDLTDAFCKGDCEIDIEIGDCSHPINCCIKWLSEEVEQA